MSASNTSNASTTPNAKSGKGKDGKSTTDAASAVIGDPTGGTSTPVADPSSNGTQTGAVPTAPTAPTVAVVILPATIVPPPTQTAAPAATNGKAATAAIAAVTTAAGTTPGVTAGIAPNLDAGAVNGAPGSPAAAPSADAATAGFETVIQGLAGNPKQSGNATPSTPTSSATAPSASAANNAGSTSNQQGAPTSVGSLDPSAINATNAANAAANTAGNAGIHPDPNAVATGSDHANTAPGQTDKSVSTDSLALATAAAAPSTDPSQVPALQSLGTSAANGAPTSAAGPVAQAALASQPATVAAAVPLAGVAVAIAGRALAGSNQFEIRLDPPDLGRIDVRLNVDKQGNVTSHLVVERSQTLTMLQNNAPQLQRALQDAGFKTTSDGLQFSLSNQGGGAQNQNFQNGGSAPNTQVVVPIDESIPLETARSYGRLLGASGGLDIRV